MEAAAQIHPVARRGQRVHRRVRGRRPVRVEVAVAVADPEGGQPGPCLAVHRGEVPAEIHAVVRDGHRAGSALHPMREVAHRAGVAVEPGHRVPCLPGDGVEVAGGVDRVIGDGQGTYRPVGGRRPVQQLTAARVEGGQPAALDPAPVRGRRREVPADVDRAGPERDRVDRAVERRQIAVRRRADRGVGR